jgi:histidinol-phosphate aminotransferase
LAALQDQDWLRAVRTQIETARDRIAEIARNNGLHPLPSAANFVTIDCGRDGAFAARVLAEIVSRGVFIRMPFCAPQNRCIRISCGTPADLDTFAAVLPEALRAAEKG